MKMWLHSKYLLPFHLVFFFFMFALGLTCRLQSSVILFCNFFSRQFPVYHIVSENCYELLQTVSHGSFLLELVRFIFLDFSGYCLEEETTHKVINQNAHLTGMNGLRS